jgi:hypoxanthine phosphoribosyltransferase
LIFVKIVKGTLDSFLSLTKNKVKTIQIKGKEFIPMLSEETLQHRIKALASEILACYEKEELTILGVLNGAVFFAADLSRYLDREVTLDFIKWTSYEGTQSLGIVDQKIGLSCEVKNRNILLVEDIIDTGFSMNALLNHLATMQPKSLRVCTLLHKPQMTNYPVQIDFKGFEIPNAFVLGYGLDYEGLGRNLKGLYQLAK